MNYINPMDGGAFDIRRLQIQKSIMNLEQRLLKRKQLDLQIEKQSLEKQSLINLRKYEGAYQTINPKNGLEIQIDERLRYLQNLEQRESLVRALQQQKLDADYLTRLRALEIQQNIIDLQNARMREKQFYYKTSLTFGDNNLYPLDVSGEVLAKKYFDGTRALELNEELKKSTDNLRRFTDRNPLFNKKELISQDKHRLLSHQKQPDHSTVKKYLRSSKKNTNDNEVDNKYHTYGNAVDPTPIKMIENSSSGFNSTAGNFNDAINKNHESQNLTKVQEQESLQESSILKSKGLKRQKSKSTQPTNQHIIVSYLQPKQFSVNRPISNQKNSRYLSNRQKSSKSLRYASGTKQSQHQFYESIEQKIRRQIQDRLRLSQQSKQILDVFYAKDITEYLMAIYGKQDKFRKQLKEKICKIPIVERKFDVGPVLE